MILLGVSMASMVGIPLAAWIANAWGRGACLPLSRW
jgi:predicted MFS family arabinose efflux permease